MTKEIKKTVDSFYKQAAENPVLKKKWMELQQEYLERISALAKEAGFEIEPEDFSQDMQPLTDEEMEGASGGVSISCWIDRAYVTERKPFSEEKEEGISDANLQKIFDSGWSLDERASSWKKK